MAAQDVNLNQNSSAADGSVDREVYPKFWIEAYTKPKSERKVAKELGKVNIETYVQIQNEPINGATGWSTIRRYTMYMTPNTI